MSEQHNPETPPRKQRTATPSSSSMLFDGPIQRAPKNMAEAIAAISLSTDTPISTQSDAIPTLIPSPENRDLQNSQLGYLRANQELAQRAQHDAIRASEILEQAKATQRAIAQTAKTTDSQSALIQTHARTINQGLEKCSKVLRESEFIAAEIQKIYNTVLNQKDPINSSAVQHLVTKLKRSQAELESYTSKIDLKAQEQTASLDKISQELTACTDLRKRLTEQAELLSQDVDDYKTTIDYMTQQGLSYLQQSETSLDQSKESQTRYFSLTQDIQKIQKDLQTQKKNTSLLSVDLQTATKAIALNKNAVDSLTSDIDSLKRNLNSEGRGITLSREQQEKLLTFEKLLEDTNTAHKRLNNLFELNNKVSDRLHNLDTLVTTNAHRQDSIAKDQEDALSNIEEQRQACKKLIDQASRSHHLILNICKKTSNLAEQMQISSEEEKKQKNAIFCALKDSRHQKKQLLELESQLKKTLEQQCVALQDINNGHKSLKEQERSSEALIQKLSHYLDSFDELSPELHKLQTETHLVINTANAIFDDNKIAMTELFQIKESMTTHLHQSQEDFRKLQKCVEDRLCDNQALIEKMTIQSDRLEAHEQDFQAHLSNLGGLSDSIKTKISEISEKMISHEAILKDIDFSNTELRYLKDQCDQILQECISQNQQINQQQKEKDDRETKLSKMEATLEKALSTQQQQEQGLEQFSSSVNHALQDLNEKISQFIHLKNQVENQNNASTNLHHETIKVFRSHEQLHAETQSQFKALKETHVQVKNQLDQLTSLESLVKSQTKNQQEQIQTQHQQINQQSHIIDDQSKLLAQVQSTFEDTQSALDTIEQIRKKAQQSFAHLAAQKSKFEAFFEKSTQKMDEQHTQQMRQERLLQETQATISEIQLAQKKSEEFCQWQTNVKLEIDNRIKKIDEYQSRAFASQQKAQAKEIKLEKEYEKVKEKLTKLDEALLHLDTTRHEEAQYRDELRALLYQHERQHQDVQSRLEESKVQHHSLTQSLEDAHLMFRENKLATKETQMANRETKLILQEIKREISQLKEQGIQPGGRERKWASEEKIERLEQSLSSARDEPEYKTSSFML